MKKGDKAQAGIITVILMILLILVTFIIVWNLSKTLIQKESNKIILEPLSVKLRLTSTPIVNSLYINLSVTRSFGMEEIKAIKFIFKNDSGSQDEYIETNASNIPKEFETKNFQFCYPLIKVTKITKASFVPIFVDNNGGNVYGILSEDNVRTVSEKSLAVSDCHNSSQNPIPICSCRDLQNMNLNLNADYELINDIDCSETINWNDGKGWEPIGNGSCEFEDSFRGNFDGNSHKINNLVINNYESPALGLFACSRGNITDLGLNISIISTINQTIYAGGITAVNYGNIKKSHTDYNIYAGYFRGKIIIAGGLIGKNYGHLNDCYSRGEIIVEEGKKSFSPITGLITGSPIIILPDYNLNYIGGLVGVFFNGNMTNSYSVSKFTDNSNAQLRGFGGLIGGSLKEGFSNSAVYIKKSFSDLTLENVNSTSGVGGLIGHIILSSGYKIGIDNFYWNNNSQELPSNCFYGIVMLHLLPGNSNCTAIEDNSAYFYSKNNQPMANWDFENIWQENPENYPTLK